ncbi:MAG: hypothetical protein A4E27_00164 [Methanobacterium sp. PtaU1.Bin242]|nr:MAG: hypothetical protein A4E27_00164 [Methanobacterium sp. PtaU1.Bin242]
MSLDKKYSYDVKFCVFQHECVDIGCFEHKLVNVIDPGQYPENGRDEIALLEAKKIAEELKCKQENQDPYMGQLCGIFKDKCDDKKDSFLNWLDEEYCKIYAVEDKYLSDTGKERLSVLWDVKQRYKACKSGR